MKQRGRAWTVAVGLTLCAAALVLSIALQRAGYLTYLNSDMASEVILARRQADTHSLVQMDWLYSTEIHTLHMNLFYALAFLLTPDFMLARIIGNTAVFLLGMGACVFLCRKLHMSWGRALAAAALLPVAASTLYAANMTIGGYYIIHLPFAFFTAGLWLDAAEGRGTRRRRAVTAAAYAALCFLQGFLSVRYVLCFVCPMMVVAALEMILAPDTDGALRDRPMYFGLVTALGFAACVLGYAAAELVTPRLFVSGTGSAGSFQFNPLDGEAMGQTLMTVFADFLKLLGWRGEAALFSPEGIVNLCVAGVIVLGALMTRRVYGALSREQRADRLQRRMMQYAGAAMLVNLFCFVFIKGTYLNRYLILAVIFLVPVLAVVVRRERSARLRIVFLALLCVQLGGSSAILLRDTRAQEAGALERGADMMDAAAYLQREGYTHGYGTFWNVRVMQERTQGALTFTAVTPAETEEGAACPVSLEMIRWLEPDDYSDLDICPGKTFLLLTHEEEQQLEAWLSMTGAPKLYENETFGIYGFESSMELVGATLFGKMKLENARAEDGAFVMDAGGRMRVPTTWREAGSYVLRFVCGGEPAQDSVAQLYTTKDFALLGEQRIVRGDNEVAFALEQDDKYFMILIKSGEAEEMVISDLELEKR